MSDYNSHNLRNDGGKHEKPPIRMQKRNALGENVTSGNPNGAPKGDTTNKIANGKNY